MKMSCISFLALLTGLFVGFGYAQQNSQFSVEAYQAFLSSNKNMTADGLMSLHPAGVFRTGFPTDVSAAAYFDSVSIKYKLTDHEKTLLAKNGFVVTERLGNGRFGAAFGDVFGNDLPVFISTDAILHSIHKSYDNILRTIEERMLIRKLDSLLALMHNSLPLLAAKYESRSEMKEMLNDVDVYLTVPRVLLGTPARPKFIWNSETVNALLNLISAEKPASYPLFSSSARDIDFSQFTVRGHYTESPELGRYFRSMMWLGRTEIYLIAPEGLNSSVSKADVQRQTIDAVLIKELADTSGSAGIVGEIDRILKFLIGESDNVTLANVESIGNEIGLKDAGELLDTLRWQEFQDALTATPFAFQRIMSQILYSDPLNPKKVKSASAFLLFGQRFIIDSYVTSNVVYDRVASRRMLPSSLDVLFATGNDAAAQLLKEELDKYGYSQNLAALRYLIDSYEEDFWTVSIYNSWLSAIRALNPPADRSGLPAFMQTAAWWQEKMNTQLASWAQLRHDNLLYAKQSYSAGIICSYPAGYVEPYPEFYDAVRSYAEVAAAQFGDLPLGGIDLGSYFAHLKNVADTLGTIARKELSDVKLSDAEKLFIQGVLYATQMCGPSYDGWYPRLFYGGEGLTESDMVVADIHTAPTDEHGTPVGWVLHVGTGPVNMAIVVTSLPGEKLTAFVGPVLSYYEHLSTGFKRLTDEEWKTEYALAPSLRPSFVNLYLANTLGNSRGEGASLLTSANGETSSPSERLLLSQNYPNPFNSTTTIAFTIPRGLSQSFADISVYDISGRLVKRIFSGRLTAGNYTVRWDGKDDRGAYVASGVYIYKLTSEGRMASGKVVLIK